VNIQSIEKAAGLIIRVQELDKKCIALEELAFAAAHNELEDVSLAFRKKKEEKKEEEEPGLYTFAGLTLLLDKYSEGEKKAEKEFIPLDPSVLLRVIDIVWREANRERTELCERLETL
jgi:hypothetical protein